MNASNDLGDLNRERFDDAPARDWYRRSVELGSALADAPDTMMARREIGYAWMRLGELSFMADDPSEGRRSLGFALELRRSLVRETGHSSWASLDLALTLRALGRGEQLAGQAEAAQARFIEALGMLETQRAANPPLAAVQHQVSNLFALLAEVATAKGNDRPLGPITSGRPRSSKGCGAGSERPVNPQELADSYWDVATFEAAALKPDASLTWADRAWRSSSHWSGTIARNSRGYREVIRRDRAHALEVMSAKASGSGASAATDPANPDSLAIRAEAAACLGRHAEAAALAEYLAAAGLTDAEAWYRLGVLYLRCRSAVAIGRFTADLSQGDRAIQDRYAALSIGGLDRAIQHGFADRNRLQEDLNFISLRSHPGFRALFQRARPRREG